MVIRSDLFFAGSLNFSQRGKLSSVFFLARPSPAARDTLPARKKKRPAQNKVLTSFENYHINRCHMNEMSQQVKRDEKEDS